VVFLVEVERKDIPGVRRWRRVATLPDGKLISVRQREEQGTESIALLLAERYSMVNVYKKRIAIFGVFLQFTTLPI